MILKGIFIVFCFGVYFAQARSKQPIIGKGPLRNYCLTSDDCKENQCCIIFKKLPKVFNRIRALQTYASGKCKRLGKKNKSCLVDGSATGTPGLYYYKCPCKQGYTCTATGKQSKYGMKGRCKKATVTLRPPVNLKPCKNHYNCDVYTECCMVRRRGKRAAYPGIVLPEAYCHPKPKKGGACHLKNIPWYRTSMYTCPCSFPLICKGNGGTEAPVGETGTCIIDYGGYGGKK